MSFDIDEYLTEGEAHPVASELLGDESQQLWRGEIGPLGSDFGHDAFMEFTGWRERHPTADLAECVRWILVDSFGSHQDPALLESDAIRRQLDEDESGSFDFFQDVYVLDETIIASALAQLIREGRVDAEAKESIRFAVARQLHPLVLQRVFGDGEGRESRASALREAERLFVAAPGRSEKPRKKRKKAKAAKVQPRCPWPAGTVLLRRLPSGRSVLLNLFRDFEETPVFIVVDWSDDDLPSPQELDAIDAKPARADWKIRLRLPEVDPGYDADTHRVELERVLLPTGLRKVRQRSVFPSTSVDLDSLDEYLEQNWEWD